MSFYWGSDVTLWFSSWDTGGSQAKFALMLVCVLGLALGLEYLHAYRAKVGHDRLCAIGIYAGVRARAACGLGVPRILSNDDEAVRRRRPENIITLSSSSADLHSGAQSRAPSTRCRCARAHCACSCLLLFLLHFLRRPQAQITWYPASHGSSGPPLLHAHACRHDLQRWHRRHRHRRNGPRALSLRAADGRIRGGAWRRHGGRWHGGDGVHSASRFFGRGGGPQGGGLGGGGRARGAVLPNLSDRRGRATRCRAPPQRPVEMRTLSSGGFATPPGGAACGGSSLRRSILPHFIAGASQRSAGGGRRALGGRSARRPGRRAVLLAATTPPLLLLLSSPHDQQGQHPRQMAGGQQKQPAAPPVRRPVLRAAAGRQQQRRAAAQRRRRAPTRSKSLRLLSIIGTPPAARTT